MMGCLAALSLAGCGGSGSSSSGPSESLISEGFEGVGFDAFVVPSDSSGYSYSYAYALELRSSYQTFTLSLPKGNSSHELTGTWSAKSLGNGKFELSLGDASDEGCKITGRTVVLTIDDMETYRAGGETTAKLSMAPFTHEGSCSYSYKTEEAEMAEIQQLRSLPQ